MADNPERCLPRIRSLYTRLSAKEKTIADYILSHPETIVHSTISEIAENLKMADATVFRFCKHIGFSGYQALKIALASEIVSPVQDIHETIHENDSEQDIVQKVFRTNRQSLEDTMDTIDPQQYKAVIDAFMSAGRIEFYGSGGSGIVALDAHHKFMRSGLSTTAYSDPHLQIMSASQLTEGDVIVLISHSGTNKDLLDILETTQDNGITSIAITNIAKSPLSQKVDIALHTVSKETDYRSEALSSRIAQLSIIDALLVNVMIRQKEKSQDALNNMRRAISIKRI